MISRGLLLSDSKVFDRYKIIGFISSGTYGLVYKAVNRNGQPGEFAIKKFKPDKEGEAQYTGISQSAVREISLCTELQHQNLVKTVEIILEDKCIFIVFAYAEHDLFQMIHHHSSATRLAIPASTVKSILFQLLQGIQHLHTNWVMHRDLKPANIMVDAQGELKIGDLGLARIFYKPLSSLFSGDKVVVTIWYRAPELLLGVKHYTPAIDLWAVGCIFGELLSLRPIFKGDDIKIDGKKPVPFQRNQMQKIVDILGMPSEESWPLLSAMPEYSQFLSMASVGRRISHANGLTNWYSQCLGKNVYSEKRHAQVFGSEGLGLLSGLLEYNPEKRLTAADAMKHPFFNDMSEALKRNCFDSTPISYPQRRVSYSDAALLNVDLPSSKRPPSDSQGQEEHRKRLKRG